jgi:uncharacterized protein
VTVILDTSFLFALTDRRDRNHVRVLDTVRTLQTNPVLPDVVLPEICYLLASRLGHQAMRQFMRRLDPTQVRIEPLKPDDLVQIQVLLDEYADSRLDFADTAIVVIAERLNITRICTLDRRDFSIIRPKHCDCFELLP